jgi:hypothetical protein
MTFESIAEQYLGSIEIENGSRDAKHCNHKLALARLSEILPDLANTRTINPDQLREALSRRFVEEVTLRRLRGGSDEAEEMGPGAFLDALYSFFDWARGKGVLPLADKCSEVLAELRQTLPRAIMIGVSLSKELAERGVATSFPEFLTSFEQGGASRYDIDSADGRGVIEGYFRIRRVENHHIEAEEIITEEIVWPVDFPPSTARLLSEGFIINMEIIRKSHAWQVFDCGFVYPPGTDL